MSEVDEPQTPLDEPVVLTESAPRPKAVPSTETRRQPPYNVVILNDEEHTAVYVVELLMKLFGHSQAASFELTTRIHNTGRGVVYTTHKEKAELKRDQVLAYGPDPRLSISRGPLGCYIEPAPTD